jgi:hypothetical protein
MLKSNQEKLGIKCDNTLKFGSCFKELIENCHKKYNQKVVVLVDEYDKAILDNLDQMDVAFANREIIKSLYTVLKGCEPYLEKVFLTGVSKFSKASIFSGLNMLKDISLTPKYGNICGYTQHDVETSVLPYLDGVDLVKLKEWYNGYNFLKDDVYNPFDILLFIDNDFLYKNYWFETGTPSYLVKLIQQKNYFLPKLSNITIGEELINSFDINNIELEVILYQAGYLTIEEMIIKRDKIKYKLKIPNKEVKISLYNYILDYTIKEAVKRVELQDNIYDYLEEANLDSFRDELICLFASIANNNYTKNNIDKFEGYYAGIIYSYLVGCGFEVISEDVTNYGRIDLTLFVEDKIYIVEFKMGDENALQQIKDKNYVQKYLSQNKDIYLVGINFDKKDRNISKFEWEKY